jgi:hypothetical protein
MDERESLNHRRLTSTDQPVEGGVMLFWFVTRGNKKCSTISLVYRVEHHFKIRTDAALIVLMCKCSMRKGL